MRILIVSSDQIPHVGGKSTHILDLKDGLIKNDMECEVISLASINKLLKTAIKFLLSPVRLFNRDMYIYFSRYLTGKLLNYKVLSICKRQTIDFIAFQDAMAAYFLKGTVKNYQIPCSLTMHTYFGIENSLDKKNSRIGDRIYTTYLNHELESLQVVQSIIAVDARIKQHILTTIETEKQKKKLSVININEIANFTNIDLFSINNEQNKEIRKAFRDKYNISDNTFVVACTRRLVEKNGVINAVRAMKFLKNKSIKLIIGGDGPQREEIEAFIIENQLEENILLLGEIRGDEIRRLYYASDISIVPSITVNGLQEATSISAIESMAVGLPTIASNIGGLAQLIKSNETGILVNEGDSLQIANAIQLLKDNNLIYNKIQINARKYIESHHSHIVSSKKYLEEFKKTIKIINFNSTDI